MWVKVCGIRTVENGAEVLARRPDAIGLNFYEHSKRRVDLTNARQIAARCDATTRVGLFVNHSLAEVNDICDAVGLSWIQLHGDEPPSFTAELRKQRPDATIIRAVRVGETGLAQLADDLSGGDPKARPDYVLIDSLVAGHYGGSGLTAPWKLLAGWEDLGLPPLILAGGLSPANVAEAIRAVRPFGVDVASGVETEEGLKDPAAVADFISAARNAEN